ncbi:MAG: RcnB family protein [Telluria sp.]
MNRRFLLSVLAVSSTFGSQVFAQSSDFRQAEQDRAAQRQREMQERPQYLPGDRRRIEGMVRRGEVPPQHSSEAPRYRDGRPVLQGDDRRGDRGRGDYRGGNYRGGDNRGGGYREYRAEEWRRDGRGAGPNRDWRRGGYLPRDYRSRNYVVDDWRAHRLYAPPRGHHWVQAGSDYVLVAITTGLIAAILLSQ